MASFSKLFGKSSSDRAHSGLPEHAVLVYLKLSDAGFGAEAERQAIHSLTDELAAQSLLNALASSMATSSVREAAHFTCTARMRTVCSLPSNRS
jgi:hypothetical protein